MTNDDKATTDEAAAALLQAAYEAGRQEAEADLFEFSNGFVAQGRGNLAEFEAALRAKSFELEGRGVRKRADHPEIMEIKREYGRE